MLTPLPDLLENFLAAGNAAADSTIAADDFIIYGHLKNAAVSFF
jgi:hypothetical protein